MFYFLKVFRFICYFMCVNVGLHVCMFTTYIPGALQVLWNWIQMAASCHVCARSQTLALHKSSQCS